VPHPDKASYGGEDAFFVSSVGGGALGVADGVGGWAESGVNPAEYSATFMDIACRYLEGRLEPPPGAAAPAQGGEAAEDGGAAAAALGSGEWLDAPLGLASNPLSTSMDGEPGPAWQAAAPAVPAPPAWVSVPGPLEGGGGALGALAAAHRLTRKPGSATACVLRLDPGARELEAANLGDSGFLLIRAGAVAFRSPPLQHFFDCPLQFGAAPEFTSDTDTAADAQVYRLPVLPGDVIVLGTDGLLDNMHRDEILEVVAAAAACGGGGGAEGAAKELAARAAAHAGDPEFASPYAAEAAAQGLDLPLWEKLAGLSFAGGKLALGTLKGGKQDDVTVVIAIVEEEAPEE
jgi:protein phosphatase PTC7